MGIAPEIPGSRRPSRAFTLLELLVVATLMILVSMMTAQMWRHFSAQAANLDQRAGAAQELRFALEGIRQDMGPVVWATPVSGDRLLICMETPDGTERTVEYSVTNGHLLRYDQTSGTSTLVADHVSAFTAENLTDTVLQLVVTITRGNTSRQATILWSRP